jgi:hypothetical protein
VIAGLAPRWKLLLAITIGAAVGIQLLEPDYNELQTAPDALAFLYALGGPGRALAASGCDMVFAAGYGTLGVIGMRVWSPARVVARIGTVLIVGSALFDEIENGFLVRNILSRERLTDGWIAAMRVPGTLKWMGSPVFLILLLVLARRELRRRSTMPPADPSQRG